MNILKRAGAEFFTPDNVDMWEALKRTTHMAISAHQDDIEIMAYNGIMNCFGRADQWFLGIVVTDGAGSARDDLYKDFTDDDMKDIRKREQKKSAVIGEYSGVALLNYPSGEAKNPKNQDIVDELKELIMASKPQVIYTHNLADKHDTHVGVAVKAIKALREVPEAMHPQKVYGCEVWRNLDWMMDSDKVMLDMSKHPNIASAVLAVHDSQICGGKRYDLATEGRRLGNATFCDSHAVDEVSALSYAMDLTPLIKDKSLDIAAFINEHIDAFKKDVAKKIGKVL